MCFVLLLFVFVVGLLIGGKAGLPEQAQPDWD
jgi:hypothetical protein